MGLLDIFKRRGAPLPIEGPLLSVLRFVGAWGNPRVDRLTTEEEQLRAYRGWVYAAVRRIIEDLRAIEWRVVDKDGNEVDNELARLLERPFVLYTWADFVEVFFLYLDLTGNAFVHVVTDERGRVLGLQPVSPYYVQEPHIEDGRFMGWRVVMAGELRTLSDKELVWSRYQHPFDPWRGASPVEAFAASHELDLYIRAYGADMVQNKAGIPAGILSTEQALTEAEAERIREQWRQRHAEAWGEEGPAVLGKGAQYQRVGIPLSDLRFLELAQVTMDQILAIYGVPASKLGLVKDVNRANAEANDRTYRANVLAPRARRLEELINVYLLRTYWPQEYARGLRFRFADVVGEDASLKFQMLLHGLRNAAVRRNEYREHLGLEPDPEDGYLMPASLVLVSEGQAQGESRLVAPVVTREALRATQKDLELAALRFLRDQEPLERSLKARVRSLFSREQKAILRAWREEAGLEQRADEGEGMLARFLERVRQILAQISEEWAAAVAGALLEGARRGWLQAFDEPPPISDFMPYAEEWARTQAGTRVVDITETTLEELRRVVARGITEGRSMAEIEDELRQVYDGWKGYRAERIARTETATAVNWGKHRSAEYMARELGKPVVKVWSAILDERVREEHAAAHGQRVPLNEPFVVGGALLMHPGDPNGPGDQVINCRCSVYYEIEGEE